MTHREAVPRPIVQLAAFRRWVGAGLTGLLLVTVLGHGCHGTDRDLEPAIPPAVAADR